MDTKNIKAEDLIGIDDYLKEKLSNLDCRNPTHRKLAVNAMEIYVKYYISPAINLASVDEDGDRYIDLEKVINAKIEGFVLSSFFLSKQKNFIRPSSAELSYVVSAFVDETTPELIDNFWKAWKAEEAIKCLIRICSFLKEPFSSSEKKLINPNVLKEEIKQLTEILKLPMTASKAWVKNLIEKEQEVLDEWYKETRKSSR